MSNNFRTLFTSSTTKEVVSSSRALPGTAQLTATASALAQQVMSELDTNYADNESLVEASKTNQDAMDNLIRKFVNIDEADISYLEELSKDTLDSILKSQQSKRSRAKSKVMTLANYSSMMMGAICELLVRRALGKSKSSVGVRLGSGATVEFTAEQLEALRANQSELKRELRNVQSKKSIMKSKPGFSTEDVKWQALLVAEAQLKENRVGTSGPVVVVKQDAIREELDELLSGVDTATLKANDGRELIAKIHRLIKPVSE